LYISMLVHKVSATVRCVTGVESVP